MTSRSAFDYATPYDIMVGYWVGTGNIYGPKGLYVMSTKMHVGIYWKTPYTKLHFREAAEDFDEFQGSAGDYLDSRRTQMGEIERVLGATGLAAIRGLRALHYDITVEGQHCYTDQNASISLSGMQTRPDVYQHHVKKKEEDGTYHHMYESHYFASPHDWQVTSPIVGPDGEVGVAVVLNFRRISFDVPRAFIRALPLSG